MSKVVDLNVDGSPEIYGYVTSVDSGSYSSWVAYVANWYQLPGEIYLLPSTGNKTASNTKRT
ncbi:hypothetical protein [Nitrosomonas communis]|uniref:hypothetical protein n=1 Tax=Nitrosomonas communis TaxID=44574 RepID=UPI0011152541|nr:hypothetical protein [Nitrosomonas communis]